MLKRMISSAARPVGTQNTVAGFAVLMSQERAKVQVPNYHWSHGIILLAQLQGAKQVSCLLPFIYISHELCSGRWLGRIIVIIRQLIEAAPTEFGDPKLALNTIFSKQCFVI